MFFEIVVCVDLILICVALFLVAYRLKSFEDLLFEEDLEEIEVDCK